MLLVVGLGNPGGTYAHTRHNVGFDVVDLLCASGSQRFRRPMFARYECCTLTIGGGQTVLAKPRTFMNRSGEILPRLMRKLQIDTESLVVVCDTLDLRTGSVRIRRGGSDAGHRGLRSIIATLSSESFVRVYVGIGRPADGDVISYVLGTVPPDEMPALSTAFGRAAEAVVALSSQSVENVMNEFNRKERQD